ncbi:MAG: TonB family protein [Bacteroidota bacterium]|nr:TonB family protein [Bacteroidota bacterium]
MAHPISFKAGSFHLPSFRHKNSPIVSALPFSVAVARKELRNALRINLERGLMVSAMFHCAVIGGYYGIEYYNSLEEDVPVVKLRIVKYSDLGPPPSITNSMTAPVVGVAKIGRPSIGTPIPVPDAEINPEQTIATQTELSSVVGPGIEGDAGGAGEKIQITEDVKIEDEPGMNEFVPVEKSPQVVQAAKPVYPEIARRAGMEGTVWVNILVDKTGKPKKAVVVKEDASGIFSQAAVDAAMKYQFTPAYMNTGPVKVWVAIKFKFQLTDLNK